MALAGPTANLILVGLFGATIFLGAEAGVFAAPDSIGFSQVVAGTGDLSAAVALVVGIFFSMNLLLFVLNMLPVPPLDGSAVLLLFIPPPSATAYQMWMRQPAVGWIGILLVFNFVGEIFFPIFFNCVSLLYPGVTYG